MASLPGHHTVNRTYHSDQYIPDIKIFRVADIERVEHGLARRRIGHCFLNMLPVEHHQQRNDDYQEHHQRQHSFDTVGNHHRQLTAGQGQGQRQSQINCHNDNERLDRESRQMQFLRQPAKIDEKPRAYCRKYPVIEHAGQKAEKKSKN